MPNSKNTPWKSIEEMAEMKKKAIACQHHLIMLGVRVLRIIILPVMSGG